MNRDNITPIRPLPLAEGRCTLSPGSVPNLRAVAEPHGEHCSECGAEIEDGATACLDQCCPLPFRSIAPMSSLDMARATRDADMLAALDPRQLRPTRHIVVGGSWLTELADDWREIIGEVRASPVSHLLVAIGAVVGWTVLLVLPTLLGAGK
jgi:hypothetical protein